MLKCSVKKSYSVYFLFYFYKTDPYQSSLPSAPFAYEALLQK